MLEMDLLLVVNLLNRGGGEGQNCGASDFYFFFRSILVHLDVLKVDFSMYVTYDRLSL